MAILIDSTVFIEAERRRLPVANVLVLTPDDEPVALAAITVSELLLGVHLGAPTEQRRFREEYIEDVIAHVTLLDFDLEVARVYADVWARLRLQGNMIAPHDLMIGSTALAHSFDVLTHNMRDFSRIPGLEVRQPAW